ncbi:hypothetical protein GCM10027597_47020 [Saccharopolyspora tripterygii]
MRGRDLTDRMTGQRGGPDVPRAHQPEQRHLDREQRRLGDPGPVQQVLVLAPHQLAHRGIEMRQHLVQRFGENRVLGVQRATHAEALRALTREQEREPARLSITGDHGRVRAVGGQRVQRPQQRVAVVRDDRRTLLEGGPRGGQRVAEVGEPGLRVRVEVGTQPRGLRAHRVPRPGRQQHRHHARLLRSGVRDGLLRRLLDDQVRVGAADAERRDPGPPRPIVLRPGRALGEHLHGALGPVHARGGFGDVQRLGQHAVPHRLHDLDDTGDTRGGLRVAHVRLHRTEQQRLVAVLAVGRQQRLRLDRVAEGGPRPVRLDDVHIGRF